MAANWTVLLETALLAQVGKWGKPAQRELFAVQELFEEQGPEAFELYADSFAGTPSWDDLTNLCPLDFFVRIGGRYLSLQLEIRPARTIIFRRARLE